MEENQERPEVEPKKQFLNVKTNLVATAIIIAIFSFTIGIHWNDISAKLFNVFNNSQNANLPEQLDYSSVDELYNVLKRKYDGQLDTGEMLDGIKKGLAQSTGDPYTVYLNDEEAKAFKDDLNGSFTGIGAELGMDKDNRLVIIAPLEGFPAEKAGLRAGDIIVKINDESTFGISVEEAVTKIRGEAGTDVELTVNRGSENKVFTITRAKIVVPSVKSEIRDDGIGYIRISRFAQDTSSLAKSAAEDFASKGVKKVILDLRSDGGGFLDAAVDVAGLWLENGTTVVEQRTDGVVTQTLRAHGDSPLNGMKTVVLINQGSASASEIVAGALHDHGAATLIGVTSFGKGSVQALENLKSGGVLKVTIARWYTPNGKNIDKEGIVPDEKVEISDDDYKNDKDPQLDAAVEFLLKP